MGAGIAGASVAFFAARDGHDVMVVDAGVERASDVPSALVNPVRGQSGRVDEGALEGMRLTWSLLDEVRSLGFDVPHERAGVRRPVPDERTRRKFEASLPSDLPHAWRAADEVRGLAAGWHSVLDIFEGGWLDGPAFVGALLRASGARVVRGFASDVRPTRVMVGEQAYRADVVVRCGGSLGTSGGTHRAGTMLLLDHAPCEVPLSFGVYAAPDERGGVLGSTFEAPTSEHVSSPPPLSSLAWLMGKAQGLLGDLSPRVTGTWTGTRLSTFVSGRQGDGTWSLTGLGSKGFLIGPLLARNLTSEVQESSLN
ncbi:glycine/D-amino acid oxidase-like deaminating enzyme [Deinococcus yavapaiensis KR-236]|uniref:Glycine/D-amino acid oxidase-like deaminating enzyme n=1 Tax=Deinococcus yavapaiensis KR-236 TaxID=694435 RepID=A0A318SAE3_9DEIO|nr:glycine/D-amino acid oxidase-like deaminating enzyme [Deinococcus yavapaiensis KR-236]